MKLRAKKKRIKKFLNIWVGNLQPALRWTDRYLLSRSDLNTVVISQLLVKTVLVIRTVRFNG